MKVEKERDDLYNSFEHTITLVMRKNEYKNVQLENQIDVIVIDYYLYLYTMDDLLSILII